MKPLGQFLLLQFQRPGGSELWPAAVLLFDPSNDRLYVRGREDYARIADADDALMLAASVKQLEADADAQGGSAALQWMESTLSNAVRISERITLRVGNIPAKLDALSAVFLE
jgi:hypothetical protein